MLWKVNTLTSLIITTIPFHRILKRLINKCNSLVLDEDVDGNTPLHLAAQKGMKYSVQLLMENHANVDARLNNCPKFVQRNSSYPHNYCYTMSRFRNFSLSTPLSLAAGSGHVKVVKLLLYFKAEICIRDRNHATPLHCAVIKGHANVAKILISAGAKCSVKDKDGYNALDLAIEYRHE